MRTCLTILVALAALLVPIPAPAEPAPAAPEAHRVVVRGRTDLADAVGAAFGGGRGAREGVAAVVVDVTPHTRAALPLLRAAFVKLDGRADLPTRWRVARLGEAFSPAVEGAGRLAPLLGALLAADTPAPNTMLALHSSIRSLPATGGTVVYLADWRFEDEHEVEELIRALERKRLRFGVVGSEAAFGRGWNDGVRDLRDMSGGGQISLKALEENPNDPAIGRRPFGPYDEEAPWHGGDTAYPHLPYRFSERLWTTEFTPGDLAFGEDGLIDLGRLADPGDLEDLLERRGHEKAVFSSSTTRRFPLPSSFGPYGLMRLAGVRAGRYVLWSWNPEHRVALTYDYGRCNQFAPDLGPRRAIKKAVPHDGAALAMLKAWALLTERHTAVVMHTAPLDRTGRGSRSIDLLPRSETKLDFVWVEKEAHRAFLEEAQEWRDAVADALGILEKGLGRQGRPAEAAEHRFRADAELLWHVLRVLHFELGEAIAVAKEVPADAWKDKDTHPGLRPVTWIERGDDPEAIRKTDAKVRDPAAGAGVEAARREHLHRYRGTPFGHQVGANQVNTYELVRLPSFKGSKAPLPGRTPSESGGETPETPPSPTTPGGGSGGGGPSTGR